MSSVARESNISIGVVLSINRLLLNRLFMEGEESVGNRILPKQFASIDAHDTQAIATSGSLAIGTTVVDMDREIHTAYTFVRSSGHTFFANRP